MSDLIGQNLGQYRIDALLGEGNMGSVYQAYDVSLARKVVLKVMHRQLATHESFQKRFMQEAQAAARLDHPSIVKIYNFSDDPYLHMVMEYISGPSLGDYAKHQQAQNEIINLDTILRLIAQVADALDYAHESGVVHRDIKPSNILIKPLSRPDRDGDPTLRVVVTDFGLAKLLEGGIHTLTGTFMGTLSYMSPEQCLGRDLDGRSDIYSLGIVLYQLATGRLPFNVKSPTDAIRMHVKELPPAPRLVRPGLPEMVEQVILQAIAKNPASRFQTGSQLADALRRCAWSLVSPTDTNALAGGEMGSSAFGSIGEFPAAPSLVDQLLIYHAGESPRVMAMEEDEMTVGRGQDNTIMLPDKGVSRHHVTIRRMPEGWQIVDVESTNGAFLDKIRLTPKAIEPWPPNTELRVGPYSLQWQKAMPIPVATPTMEELGTSFSAELERPSQTNPGEIEIVADPSTSKMAAGNRLNLQVMLINRGPIVEHVNVRIDQLPDTWVNYSEQLIRLMPGSRGFVRVEIDPPYDSNSYSGSHPFKVVATPMSNPEALVEALCDLVIEPFSAFAAIMKPTVLRSTGKCQIEVTNRGNSEARYVVRKHEENKNLEFAPAHSEFRLEPGHMHVVDLRVAPLKRSIFGAPKRQPFMIEVWSPNTQLHTLQGEMEIRPIIPFWMLFSFITLTIALGVFALIWFYILSTL